MARRSASQTTERERPAAVARTSGGLWLAFRTAVTWGSVLLLILGGLWTAWEIDSFLLSNPMFTLAGPPEPGTPNPQFQVIGAVHTTEEQVARVFASDFGRSIYLCPLAERRRKLLAINWVKEASVMRIWPSSLVVRLEERTPVAFAQLTARDGTESIWLVDAEGVLLDPQRAAKLGLPFISGIKANESENSRRERVKRFLRVQSDLGKLMDQIAETDVGDINNIRVTQVFHGRALTMMLGNQQFLGRYLSFRDNYEEIRKRLPNATVFDVRLKDRITAIESDEPKEDVPEKGKKDKKERKR